VLTPTDTILLGSGDDAGLLKVSTDVDGNVIVAGTPPATEGGSTLGKKFTATIQATIDVKPRAKKNKIHLRTRTVQVAIISTPTFDATDQYRPPRPPA